MADGKPGTAASKPTTPSAHRKPATGGFDEELAAAMPGLRRYARSLTRNPIAADDLVQETLARGIEKIHLWQPGTNLRAWLFTMLHNRHVDGIRRTAREGIMVELAEANPSFMYPPRQTEGLLLRDLQRALAQLPDEQRSVVLLVGAEGQPYAAVASRLDIPIGTVRSRASRGRQMLRRLMDGTPAERPPRRPADLAVSRGSSAIP